MKKDWSTRLGSHASSGTAMLVNLLLVSVHVPVDQGIHSIVFTPDLFEGSHTALPSGIESSRLQLLVLGSYSLPNLTPDHLPPFQPSFPDIRRARLDLSSRLPKTIVDNILHLAEYYYIIHAEKTSNPWEQFEAEYSPEEFGMFYVKGSYLTTQPLTEEEARSIARVTAVVEGCDQGWSGEPEEHGRATSHTWYTVGLANKLGEDEYEALPGASEFLGDNLHAIRVPQMHAATWELDSPFVSALRQNASLRYALCIWAEARFVTTIVRLVGGLFSIGDWF